MGAFGPREKAVVQTLAHPNVRPEPPQESVQETGVLAVRGGARAVSVPLAFVERRRLLLFYQHVPHNW